MATPTIVDGSYLLPGCESTPADLFDFGSGAIVARAAKRPGPAGGFR
jgi:hypothetical protein